jgi:hypothetical protein
MSTNLTTPLINEGDSQDLCSICLEKLTQNPSVDLELGETSEKVIQIGSKNIKSSEPNNMVAEAPCHHFYHTSCIAPWINAKLNNDQNPTCPQCRGVINSLNIGTIAVHVPSPEPVFDHDLEVEDLEQPLTTRAYACRICALACFGLMVVLASVAYRII